MKKMVSFVGWSGSGKTTLVSQVVSELSQRHLRIAVIKHAHHGFTLDKEGSDSDIYKKSGADAVMLASPHGMALMMPGSWEDPVVLAGLVPDVDLVITEGFKKGTLPKIEVYRAECGKPGLGERVENLVAIATDDPVATNLPVFSLTDIAGIADFIQRAFL